MGMGRCWRRKWGWWRLRTLDMCEGGGGKEGEGVGEEGMGAGEGDGSDGGRGWWVGVGGGEW